MPSISINGEKINITTQAYTVYNNEYREFLSVAISPNETSARVLGDSIAFELNKNFTFDNGNYFKFYKEGGSTYLSYYKKGSSAYYYRTSVSSSSSSSEVPTKFYFGDIFMVYDSTLYRGAIWERANGKICSSALMVNPNRSNFWDGVTVDSFPGPDSGDGGGGGNFDGSSDNIDFPELPTIGALTTRMVTMYNPESSQLSQLSEYLWKPDFIDLIGKLFQSPMEAIIDLSFVNVQPTLSTGKIINVGWIPTGVLSPVVSEQYVSLDCGTLKIDEYWGSALDYNPYTSLEIFLPYIGLQRLDIDDCMGATLNLRYHIDLLTGTCVAMIKVTKGEFSSVLYSFTGNASSHVPLSATNMSQIVQSVMNVAAQIGIGVATGGASAVTSVVAGSAMNALGSKTHVEKGGRLDTTGGMLSIKIPYVIITRPIQSLPSGYNTFKGYPSNISAVLGTLSGYTEVEYIHMDGFSALENEKEEIERLLKSGVII